MEDVIKKSQKMEFSLRSRSHGTGRIRDRGQIRPNPPCVHPGPLKSYQQSLPTTKSTHGHDESLGSFSKHDATSKATWKWRKNGVIFPYMDVATPFPRHFHVLFDVALCLLRPRSHGTGRIRDRAQIRPKPPCVHTGPLKSDEFEHHLPDEFATKKS